MISIIASSAPGLSPLARGTLTAWYAESHPERFIPAGAGNTEASNIWWTKRTVYPRWRGEHCTRRVLATGHPGLSPLARGTRICQRLCGAVNRFIPAGAGNTTPATCFASRSAVYPRWRGEHVIANRGEINRCGLSPLARGTPNWISLNAAAWRFIPAGAGNTSSRRASKSFNSVYPRWRGEHRSASPNSTLNDGLSPLARGTHCHPDQPRGVRRFIPAGAGNTLVVRFWNPIKAVYPRWRGEHYRKESANGDRGGLSPLARGTRCEISPAAD